MKNDPTEAARKAWSTQHALLRRLLEVEQDIPAARAIFLEHHAMLHSPGLQAGASLSFQDEALRGWSSAQLRALPGGKDNSAAWCIWHITRIEDATLNVLLADEPQVFQEGGWQKKTKSPFVDTGNGMDPGTVAQLSSALDLDALLAYRLAVGVRTREIVKRFSRTHLDQKPDPARLERLKADGTVRPTEDWLLGYWGGHPGSNLLLMPATRHPFVHLNEIKRLLPKLRRI